MTTTAKQLERAFGLIDQLQSVLEVASECEAKNDGTDLGEAIGALTDQTTQLRWNIGYAIEMPGGAEEPGEDES